MESDIIAVNPSYNSNNPKTSQNCGLCAMTFEMRRRGYDVTAGFSSSGAARQDFRQCFRGGRFKTRYGDRAPSAFFRMPPMSQRDAIKVYNNFASEKNTRGILSVGWGYGRGGHALNYEVNSRGQLTIYDSQVRRVYTGQQAISFLMNVSSCETYRTDNLKIDAKYMIEHKIIL